MYQYWGETRIQFEHTWADKMHNLLSAKIIELKPVHPSEIV